MPYLAGMLKKEKLALIRQWYPNAITTIDHINRLIDFVEDQLELETGQVMMADSLCSDDVNSIQFPVRAQEFQGPFKMGGLDGFPFTGLTGMAACASHVPDNGALLLYYGPHIGVSKNGALGEINRHGQQHQTTCCGAANAAVDKLLRNQLEPGEISEIDYQMQTIEQILLVKEERIRASAHPILEATEVIYEAIDRRINELVAKSNFSCKYIILLGAILINSDSDMGSYIATHRFDIIPLATGIREDHLRMFA